MRSVMIAIAFAIAALAGYLVFDAGFGGSPLSELRVPSGQAVPARLSERDGAEPPARQPLEAGLDAQRLPGSMEEVRLSFAPVVRLVAPAVVNVFATRTARREQPMDSMMRRFFGGSPNAPRMASSLGSGVIIAPDGVIVTNHHVIADADQVRIALSDRREFDCDIVLRDERTDLAILKVRGLTASLPYADIGDSDALEVGDIVLAIGNPFGVGQTVTQGIVSGLARTRVGISDFQSFVQTDAAINPGNSGGALVDLSGRLVGINTAIFSRSGGSVGIGFAIPTSMVELVAEQAAAGGRQVQRPYFGAELQEVTADLAAGLGFDRPQGVLVLDVVPSSPAAEAGIARGDVLLSIDGTAVFDPNGFEYRFATRGVSGVATIEGVRGSRAFTAEVRLAPPPETVPRDEILIEGRSPFTGARVANLSPAVAAEMGASTTDGVIITRIERGSIAERMGLRVGDIIRGINDETVRSTRDLARLAGAGYRLWRLIFERGGQVRQAVVRG